jgi:hypothetical protein
VAGGWAIRQITFPPPQDDARGRATRLRGFQSQRHLVVGFAVVPANSYFGSRLRRVAEENTLRACRKNLFQTCSSQSVQVLPNFGQLVLVLDQIGSIAQLFPPPLRATFEPKLKYENVHTTVYPESLSVAGAKGAPCQPVPPRGIASISIFSRRAAANSNR